MSVLFNDEQGVDKQQALGYFAQYDSFHEG